MHDYQRAFLNFALEMQVLKFGEFTLKSGRLSPYFFNSGLFNSGKSLAELGRFYAKAIVESNIAFDMLFGPAYKGIAICLATAFALQQQYDINMPVCFNRKEQKQHGEGGTLLGATVYNQRVILVDDVLTAGTAMREAIHLLQKAGAQPVAVFIALDRQEASTDNAQMSTLETLAAEFQVPVHALVTLNQVLEYLRTNPKISHDLKIDWARIERYRDQFGCKI